jgi:HEAT repeat protein
MTRRLPILLALAGPYLRPDGLAELEARLKNSDKWVRAAAVESLARQGSGEAWALVIEALSDPKGEVADTAQLLLAALEDPEFIEWLGGEQGLGAKEPLVRARVAELLGRLRGDPPVKLLLRGLHDGEAEVRRMAAWSVERLARGQRLAPEARPALVDELERRVSREREPLARGRALAALAELDPAAARPAAESARRADEPLVRSAAAALLPRLFEAEQAGTALAGMAADRSPCVRAAALDGLAELGTRAASGALIDRLEEEPEERLLLRLIEHLQRLSGLKHRRDPRPWRDWLRGLPADWRAPRGLLWRPDLGSGAPPSPAVDPGARTSALAGLPILSRRVAILIDLSGSIWNVRPDGRTRKQVVDEKLRETLLGFSPDVRFNLIPYTGEPIPWQEELVSATPAHVRAAAGWFEQLKASGSGNFWDAALLALADPEVDTIVVLFDGAPTGGTRHRLELLVPLFLELDSARRVAVDMVLVDGSRKLERAWGELAHGTGGRLVTAEL